MKYLLVLTGYFIHIFGHFTYGEEINADKEEQSASNAQEQYPDESYPPYQNQPLGHSRPFYFQQEGAYSQRTQPPYHQQLNYDSPLRFNGFKDDSFRQASAAPDDYGILGSGNFGVIKGGTFYNDNDRDASSNYDDFNSYFHNGHGRPSYHYGGVPNPRPYQHEQFDNFKDFADINTPNEKRDYSHYVVVYINQNETREDNGNADKPKPKNIIESLELLDKEAIHEQQDHEEIPKIKLSLSKRKLSKLLPEKKVRSKKISAKDYDPLVALS
ncbi:unnamed protein product [Brassicogethes aeneus]|uniref:Uncharacterized protein n=1 Tax=Brassicogethes aeneus TaxID=1431903 RepID=A0A9P0B3A6_BRAAE|nr:unnamed protein product [Brassicogethes aeneus]